LPATEDGGDRIDLFCGIGRHVERSAKGIGYGSYSGPSRSRDVQICRSMVDITGSVIYLLILGSSNTRYPGHPGLSSMAAVLSPFYSTPRSFPSLH